MKRRHRLLIVAGIGAGASLGVWLLTSLGSATEGPLSSTLARIGAATAGLEQRMLQRIKGPGRRARLEWLAPIARDAERLRQPPRLLLGAYDSGIPGTLQGVLDLEDSLHTTFAVVQMYAAWGDGAVHQFPLGVLSAIRELGSIPLVTWEPWLTAFESRRHPHLPLPADRDQHGLGRVAAGDYDFYIDQWAREAARFGSPILVRLGHEMNDAYRYPWGPQHNTKEEYIDAWQHVVTRFRAAGATNVLWVWSPHVAYQYWELYYPGSEYVDWVATGVLNFGPIAQWSQWWTFDEIFGTHYDRLAGFGKPIMVAEFGSLAVGGDRAEWYGRALRDIPARYPQVRSVVFFNVPADQTVTYQKVDWTVTSDSATMAAARDALLTVWR